MHMFTCQCAEQAYEAGRADASSRTSDSEAWPPGSLSWVASLLNQLTVLPSSLLTIAQAATVLGVTRRFVPDLICAGEVATVRLPSARTGKDGAHHIERVELDALVERQAQRAVTALRSGRCADGPNGARRDGTVVPLGVTVLRQCR